MKNKKKWLLIPLIAAILTGGFYGLKAYRNSSKTSYVVPVSMLNQQFYEEGASMYGNIYNSDTQNIYLEPTSIVERIYVSEGQQVAKGDPLISFDQTSQELTYQIKELEVESLRNQLAEARIDLARLQAAKPAPEHTPEPEPVIEPEPVPEPEPTPEPVKEEQKEEAWTVIRRLDQKYETDDGLLHYLLTADGLLYGSFFNELKKQEPGTVAVLEVREGNTKEGTLMSSWTINSSFITLDYADTDCWFIMSHDRADGMGSAVIDPNASWPDGSGSWVPEGPGGNVPVTPSDEPVDYNGMYTKEELAEMIASRQNDIRNLDLSIRRGVLELKMMRDAMSDGVIYAEKPGVVKTLGDPADPPKDGSPFMVVASGTGVTARASVSELQLDQIKIGLPVTVTCFDTGDMFEAKVQSVDVYPSPNNMYGGGNPNASYYDFYVYADEAPSIPPYAFLQITLGANGGSSAKIAVENAFIRSDGGGSYVMKEEEGRLKKQYVRTGKTYYGYATEILEGLSEEDAITFPYGSGAIEGSKAERTEDMGVFWQ